MSSAADWIAKGRPVQRTVASVLAPVLSAVDVPCASLGGRTEARPTITRPTAGTPAKTKLLDVMNRALACCAGLPERDVSVRTTKDYSRTFRRMRREPVLDPLREGIARNTYNHRRASLHFGSRRLLLYIIGRCIGAAERHDESRLNRWIRVLYRALNRIEPALALDPPLQPGASTWSMPPSRWSEGQTRRPRRGRHSKKHVLRRLPRDWMDRLWDATPDAWAFRDQLAVHMTAPSRPEDLAPGSRPDGWSEGAIVVLRSPNVLEITIKPAKSHGGKFGSPRVTISWDPTLAGRAAAYLAARCGQAGGQIVVSLDNKNAMRKSLRRLGRRVFPELDETITAYVIRHQVLADLKATAGAGETVAGAAGQCTDRTQSLYGRVEHGRHRKGFIGVTSARTPRVGNAARGAALKSAAASLKCQ